MFFMYLASSFGSPLRHLAATAAATLLPPFRRITLLKLSLLSTYTAGIDTPTSYPEEENKCPISDFLLKECGLCLSEVSTILKSKPSFLRTRSTHIAQQSVQVMRDSGFTECQVKKIIIRNPTVLTLHADRQWKPKFELMKKLGLTAEEFGKIICIDPRLLGCSLEKTLCPNIQYLQNLLGSEANVSKVLKCAPQVLVHSNGPEYFEKKLKHLASFGFLEDEIKELVRRGPSVLNLSMDKVQKNMDFFIHTAGLPAKCILVAPQLLNLSLECRIKPRHKVFKSISALQPSRYLPSLPYALKLSEEKFLEKYVKCSPHATKLLEIYSGKSVDLDIIQ